MKTQIDIKDYRYTGKGSIKLGQCRTALKSRLYADDIQLNEELADFQKEIDGLQQQMFAHDRHALLLVFQAMDAAGKDGTIKHVMSGINPHGVEVHSFRRPSDEELDHDYLWRTARVLPARGTVGIFNRSYYEEVLVVRVHPEIVLKGQRLPKAATKDLDALWDRRFKEIRNFESMLTSNGTQVAKFYLHVSRDEQKKRFLERIDKPSKNWKFNTGDLAERKLWKEYMKAYEAAIEATASKESPWYVVPADDKGDMRLIVSAIILDEIKKLDLAWPVLLPDQKAGLAAAKAVLLAEKS